MLGYEEIDDNFDCFRNVTLATVKLGDNAQLAGINGKNPDISAFITGGGVLLQ